MMRDHDTVTMTHPPDTPRRLGVRAIAVLLTALGINALVQVPQFLPGWGNDPGLLSLEQLVTGVLGVAAGMSAWRHQSTAWVLAIVWGAMTCVLLLSLPPLLELDAEAAVGIRYGALVILAVTALIALYLRHVLVRPLEH